MERSSSLLDEALGLDNKSCASSLSNGRVLLIEDCVETSGMFVIYHIIKRTLSSHSSGVIFVALSHPFSHYDRILRKLGCNLTVHRDNKKLVFFDMLMLESADGVEGKVSNVGLIDLYEKIQRAVSNISSRQESRTHVTIVIDDFSLIEIAAHGSSNHGLDFLHYCHTLTSELGCSLVILNHKDIYSCIETPSPILQMEYLADVLIKAEPLATGLATDVHGQLTVMNKGIHNGQRGSWNSIYNVHFRLKENGVDCFYPGSQT